MTTKIVLVKTCNAYPEQYDAFVGGKQVGYLRLRHGRFSVSCPDAGGEEVYFAHPDGYGEFTDNERDHYLDIAKEKISIWRKNNKSKIKRNRKKSS